MKHRGDREAVEDKGQMMQTLETSTRIPFVDLKAQYDSIKQDVDAAIAAVITQTAFIGGPFVKERAIPPAIEGRE